MKKYKIPRSKDTGYYVLHGIKRCPDKSGRQYKTVFFDAGGTLLTVYPSVGKIYSEVSKKYGCDADPAEIERIFHEKRSGKDKRYALVLTTSEEKEKKMWYDLVYEIFSSFGKIDKFDEFFDELYEAFADAKYWRLYPETKTVLSGLKKKDLKLGIVSNWDSRLYSLCSQMGIKEYFDFIVVSAEIGESKPSKKIFREALKKSGAGKNEIVHIGDHPVEDIEGALNFGIDAILIDRKGNNNYNKYKVISSLNELIGII